MIHVRAKTLDQFGRGCEIDVTRPRFVTGQLAVLDVGNGRLELVTAGHPGPLLVRDARVIDIGRRRPARPLGLGDLDDTPVEVQRHVVQRGDRLLFYTDGVIDARAFDGSHFGEERLVATIRRAHNDVHVPAEAVRRLMHALGTFSEGGWRDDATIVMVHRTHA